MSTKKKPDEWHEKPYNVSIPGEVRVAWKVGLEKFRVRGPGLKAEFTHVYFRCTKCSEMKPPSQVHFRMEKGLISNEPQCSKCRNRKKAQGKKKTKATRGA